MPNWNQLLWDYLCQMMQLLGHNCNELPPRPPGPMQNISESIAVVDNIYRTSGLPSSIYTTKKATFISLLDSMDAHLAKPENDLSPADNEKIHAMLHDMRMDVGG